MTLNVYLVVGLGIVTKCSLTGAVKNIKVDGRSYCVVDHGSKKHPEAVEFCRNLNARLPLPRNKGELDEFRKISPSFTNIDARNPKRSSNKAEWIDAEGKPLGNRPVYLKGYNFLTFTIKSVSLSAQKLDFFSQNGQTSRYNCIYFNNLFDLNILTR